MEFTGERYMPQLGDPEISFEHWHRYLWASPLAQGKSVLDVACGEGYGAALLAQVAAQVVGVDSDAETIAHAQATYARPGLDFILGRAQQLPLHDEKRFDAVVSFETIEHLSETDQHAFLCEIKRVLKPGGVAILSTPDRATYSDRPQYRNPFHIKELYLKDFATILQRSYRYVHLFGQRMYAGSYIWPLDDEPSVFKEFQLEYRTGRFTPAADDIKEPLYLLAVCSDEAIDACGLSFLLDASDRMMDERRSARERLHEREIRLQEQAALLAQAREQTMLSERKQTMLSEEVQTLRTSLAHQEAHLELLSERHTFLTSREAESRRQVIAAHEQLALRDADYRNLLANFEKQRQEHNEAQERLVHAQEQITHLSVESARMQAEAAAAHKESAEASRYAEDLERSWKEKNAHIAMLEQRLRTIPAPVTPRTLANRVLQRLPFRGRA